MTSADSPISRLVVGVMTGTSIDGIDAALVRIDGRGLGMKTTLLKYIARPLGEIAGRLRAAATQCAMTAGEFAKLTWEFGELHASVIAELGSDFDMICVHGQTVFHQPPISWQLMNVAPIAERFRCAVVSDLRQADLAAGGQGAPITPIADWILFRDEFKRRAILNLGGFCNVTILPSQQTSAAQRAGASSPADQLSLAEIRGFDVCACNQLLDEVARTALGKPFDENGAASSRGIANRQAGVALVTLLEQQRRSMRSLGTGDETSGWVRAHIGSQLSPEDIAATAVDAVASCIGNALLESEIDEIIVAGGGAKNHALINAIEHHSRRKVMLSDAFGVPIEARESMEFAILGALCADGVPITLPQITGCRKPAPLSGMWTLPQCAGKSPIKP